MPELLLIRLPDGELVYWTPQQILDYHGDWEVEVDVMQQLGAQRLLDCIAHGNGERCEVCRGDT